MARSAFAQVIELQLQRYSPEEAKRKHIEIARRTLAGFMAGQESKPGYTIEVDGHTAGSEEAVKPFGVIVYRFTRMREIARYALDQAIAQSPVESGAYKKSWFLLVENSETAPGAIPQNALAVILTNDQPYARKIEMRGARLRGVPPGIVERVRQLVLRRYRTIIDVNMEYLTLAGGHVLKRNGVRVRRNGRRSSRNNKGQALTYPALVITSKF